MRVSLDLGENDADPAVFRDCVGVAEKCGFDAAWFGDHFMPWFHSAKRSAFVWSLIGSSLERTKSIRVGPYVTSPIGGRYHPALIAQASATLDNMYPGRFLLAVGTGEAMNEVPFMERWPSWQERIERLAESVTIIRKFWKSNSYFDFEGKFFRMKQVFLYTKPKTHMKIYFSGVGPKSAYYAGKYGDHLVTLSSHNPLERCKATIFPEFERGVREAGKDPHKAEKIVSLSFTLEDKKTFLKTGRRTAGIIAKGSWNEPDPRRIEAMGLEVSEEDLLKSTHFCSGWDDLIDLMWEFHEAGASEISLYSGPDSRTIRTYARKVLPHFRRAMHRRKRR